jgi:hypothetical protein
MSETKLVYSELTGKVYAGKFSQRDGYQSANGKVHDVTQSFIDCVIKWVGENSERTIRAGDREWTISCRARGAKARMGTSQGLHSDLP